MEYTANDMTVQQIRDFLNDRTMLTMVDPDSKYYNTSDANYMKADIGSYTFVDDVSANMLSSGKWDEWYEGDEVLQLNVLVNRYKTVDGKNIEEYTADPESYVRLCENVSKAMQSLAYNYDEYLTYQAYYDSGNTNLRYCIEKTVGDHTEYFRSEERRVGKECM